jgi:hypothetical protein
MQKPHNTAKELIISCAVEIASVMFDEKTASLNKAIPSSDNTVQRRIQDMASDMTDQVLEKNKQIQAIFYPVVQTYKYCR